MRRSVKRKYLRGVSPAKSRKLIEGFSLTDMFERFMAVKRTEGLAERTLQDYEIHFGYLVDYLDGDVSDEEINIERFREYISYMLNEKKLSPVTINIRLRTLRAFLKFCYSEGYLPEPIHEKIKLLKTEEDTIESFTLPELRLLLAQPEQDTYVGFRDYVMMLTLLDTMVRISELLAIKRYNVDLKLGQIKLDAAETKTKRTRIVPISSKTARLLKEYITETADFYTDTLFVTYDGNDLKPNSFRERLTLYGEMAGIINKRVSPHTFRHTGALLYIMNGGDPFSLQRILGHSDMSMVRRYIQMTSEDVKQQHNVFSPLKNLRI